MMTNAFNTLLYLHETIKKKEGIQKKYQKLIFLQINLIGKVYVVL